jgi:hypothetical protein
MSNNLGKKGKPAPLSRREQESLAIARQRFLEEQLPAYATWCQRRNEQFRMIEKLANIRYPLIDIELLMNDWIARSQAVRENDATERRKKDFIGRHERNWENKHPSPLTWEKRRELEAEFARTYVPIDRS